MKTWIEKAAAADIDEMGRLYDSLNDYLEQHVNYPGWRKGIYPAREDAEKGIKEKNLYVLRNEREIMGSIILSHEPEAAYEKADWHVDLEYKDIFVIHTFAVHPPLSRKRHRKKADGIRTGAKPGGEDKGHPS